MKFFILALLLSEVLRRLNHNAEAEAINEENKSKRQEIRSKLNQASKLEQSRLKRIAELTSGMSERKFKNLYGLFNHLKLNKIDRMRRKN